MEGFDYEIKIENSPLNVGINLNGFKVKSMELPPTPKVNDFNVSFKDDSINNMLYDWMKSISEDINENTVFDLKQVKILFASESIQHLLDRVYHGICLK